MSNAEIVRAAAHRRMRWVNGGGWTTEIVAFPAADSWDWRLSVAEVDTDGPFSVFHGIDRTIALLRGHGFALTIDGTPERILDEPFRPYEFDGAADTRCRLVDGPIEDLNLMVRRGTPPQTMSFVMLQPGASTSIMSATVLVTGGEVIYGADRLQRFDLLRFNVDCSVPSPQDAAVVSAAAGRPAVIALISPSEG